MNKLIMFIDDSNHAKSAQELAISGGYDLEIIRIVNRGIDTLISNDLLDIVYEKSVFVAADENFFSMLRMAYLKVLESRKAKPINLIDSTVELPKKIKLGKNIYIGSQVFLGENLSLEDGVILDKGSIILSNSRCSKGVFIGAQSVVGPNAQIGSNSIIGSNISVGGVMVGSKCKIQNQGQYLKNIPAYTSFIENNHSPVIFHENPIENGR